MSLRQFLLLSIVAFSLAGCSSDSNLFDGTDGPPPVDPGPDGDGDDGGDDGSGGDDGTGGDGTGGDGTGGDGTGGDGTGGDGTGGDGTGGDGTGGDGTGGDGTGGDGGTGGGDDPTVPPEDVSGIWYSRTEVNAVNCGLAEFIDAQAFSIEQDASTITVLASSGDTFAGTVNGDIVEWSGSYPERSGTTTFTTLSIVVSGDSASGNADWTWTDGTDSCNGTMVFNASRNSAMLESDFNSSPRIADPLPLADGVAFAMGETLSGNDLDYFLVTLATDAIIEVELSHFDTQVNNLDLQLLDDSEAEIAFSASTDSFEKLEAQLSAGTYYIGVLPTSSPGPASYVISIDVN